jgi:hypothetical protein
MQEFAGAFKKNYPNVESVIATKDNSFHLEI